MASFDWTRIDDYQFVKITGDLLARQGFIDVDYQGHGPDGGIDLFATELLPFAIQGRTPFRWAIQCKFSVKADEASVSDHEIRDVEGILRSERYHAQTPRGYMLVTNRRIVQNVIERLRGIDRSSPFRTARIDKSQFESLLSEYPEIVERYFGDTEGLRVRLGSPLVIASASGQSSHSLPNVTIRIRSMAATTQILSTPATIDTAAQVSAIPRHLATRLGLIPHDFVVLRTFGSPDQQVPKVYLDVSIENAEFCPVEMIVADVSRAIIGWNILKEYSTLLESDGTIRLYRSKKTNEA